MAESTAQLTVAAAFLAVMAALFLVGLIVWWAKGFVTTTHHRNDQQLREFGDKMLAINDDCREAAREARQDPRPDNRPEPRVSAREDELISVTSFPPHDNGTGDQPVYHNPR